MATTGFVFSQGPHGLCFARVRLTSPATVTAPDTISWDVHPSPAPCRLPSASPGASNGFMLALPVSAGAPLPCGLSSSTSEQEGGVRARAGVHRRPPSAFQRVLKSSQK